MADLKPTLKRRSRAIETLSDTTETPYQRNIRLYGRENINEKARNWRRANPEKAKNVLARSRKNHPERNLFNKARANAKRMGVEFNLELTDIKIPEICPLLGVKLDSWGHKDVCPSLDRIDSTNGYVKGNVHVISWKANRMKNTATIQELLIFCKNGMSYWRDIVRYD